MAQVPWARHGAGHTHAFDDTAAWLATHCSKSAVRQLLRIAWATVGAIVTRVVADAEEATDRFATLRRIGIDEVSYKRGASSTASPGEALPSTWPIPSPRGPGSW